MINKIYKIIHNKYSTLFKFLFFLRYLFAIFFISVLLFLSIPYFFDFKKKDAIIKNYLLESYNLKLVKYDDIKYNSLPIPNLEIFNASNFLKSSPVRMDTNNIKIYLKLKNIYSFENFNANKIILSTNRLTLNTNDLKILNEYIVKLKKKITLNNLEIKIFKDDKLLSNLQKINFSNHGYNKNLISGEVFKKKFRFLLDDSYKKINLKLLNSGVNIDFDLNENRKTNSVLMGIIKAKILNSKLKFNFEYTDKKFKIYNFYFRSHDFSFNNESVITYNPFFSINSNYIIEDINIEFLKSLNLRKILDTKKIIKKINSSNTINYKSKKFNKDFIDDLNLKVNLAYGRLVYSKNFLISDNLFSCDGHSNLLEEFPILYFNCSIISEDKKSLLKEFSIKYKNKNELFKLNVRGRINILNNKINFEHIEINQNYTASKEDLNYFKLLFESVVFDKDFLSIFNFEKIKDFILEVS